MSEYLHKSHNVTVLLYHLVFPAKYRRAVFDDDVDSVLKEVCLDISARYEMKFVVVKFSWTVAKRISGVDVFKLQGRTVSERGMHSVRVVEADDVLVDVGAGLQGIGILPPPDPFHFLNRPGNRGGSNP